MRGSNLLPITLVTALVMNLSIPPLLAEDKPTPSLVRAKVKSIDKVTPNSSVATLEIVHVYSGPAELIGRSFRDTQMFAHSAGYPALARFEVDEQGIYVLKPVKDELLPTFDSRFPFFWRSRKPDDQRHAQHLLLADTIQTYTAAKREDQPGLAAKLAQDATPEVGYWMVRTLGDLDATFAADLLSQWRKKPGGLPLQAQIGLDEVLCAKAREDWATAPVRTALLESWVTGKADEYHAQRILSRLDTATQHDELPGDEAIKLIQLAAGNQEWRKEDRRRAVDTVGTLARRMADHRAAYDWLFDQMRTHPDPDTRRTAANVVGSLSLRPERARAVEDYLATEKDAAVVKALRDAVKWAKEAEKRAEDAEKKK